MEILNRIVANPVGAFLVLTLAAFLEAHGDAFFQSAFWGQPAAGRWWTIGFGTLVLALYGSVVNIPHWDFGKLLGLYVVMFFVMAQLQAKVRFGQAPTPPIYLGGSLIVAGGLVIAFWKG
jgi:small multidrug resistance family-3 protein